MRNLDRGLERSSRQADAADRSFGELVAELAGVAQAAGCDETSLEDRPLASVGRVELPQGVDQDRLGVLDA
jgi:hypothetical protein